MPNDNHDAILQYNLDESVFLAEWVKKYAGLIPVELQIGGKATPESCPKAYSRWNYRAALWFRKIASLQYALTHHSSRYKRIVWIDSDCVWTKGLPQDFGISLIATDAYTILVRSENGLDTVLNLDC